MSVFTSEIDIYANYPTVQPSIRCDFANSRALGNQIRFTRNSIATYVSRNRLIVTVGKDEPRFDHDPITGESLGLLIEEQKTNDITQSNASNWSNSGVSKSTNTSQDVSPEGLNTATIVSESTNNGLHRIKSPNISFTNTRTFSVWIKRNSGTRDLYINANAIMGAGLNFNFDTETLGSTTGTASFERYPNQWYRFSLSGTGTGNTNGVYIQFTESGDEGDDSYVGNSSNSFLVWGAQLEWGVFASSLIPTSGTAVTREEEEPMIDGRKNNTGLDLDNREYYNPEEGTHLIEFRGGILQDGDADATILSYTTDGIDRQLMFSGTVSGGGSTPSETSIGYHDVTSLNGSNHTTSFKTAAFAYGGTTMSLASDGNVANGTWDRPQYLNTDSGQVLLGHINLLHRGINGHIKKYHYYPRRVSETQLKSLTGVPTEPPSGSAEFTTVGTSSWTAPDEVTSVSVVAVGGGGGGYGDQGGGGGGLGWKNNIPVVPGQSYTVVVGNFGNRSAYADCDAEDSYFISPTLVKGGGGIGGGSSTNATYPVPSAGDGTGGDYVGDGGGTGGQGGGGTGTGGGGGGGAGGYSGDGGDGGQPGADGQNGSGGSGAGGGGGGTQGFPNYAIGGSGGGVGLLGEGASGTGGTFTLGASTGGTGGSGGNDGQNGESVGNCAISTGNTDHLYGGGGASGGNGNCAKRGARGAVRIAWGAAASFP